MDVMHIDKNGLMELFIKTQLDNIFGQILPEVIEEYIPLIPLEQQQTAYDKVQKMKQNPRLISILRMESEFCSDDSEDRPIAYDSEAFRCFNQAYEELKSFCEANQELIIESFEKAFAMLDVQLIVNLQDIDDSLPIVVQR